MYGYALVKGGGGVRLVLRCSIKTRHTSFVQAIGCDPVAFCNFSFVSANRVGIIPTCSDFERLGS